MEAPSDRLNRVPGVCHEHRDAVESSLRAESKLLLEPPALRVTRLDDASARRVELVGARSGLRLERGIRHRELRRCRHRLEELPVGQERFVVDKHRDLVAANRDRSDFPARAGGRQLDGSAGFVHEGACRRQAVADHERRIAECASELAAKGRGLLTGAEVDDESRDHRLRPTGTEQVDRESDRREGDHEEVRPEEVRIRASSAVPRHRARARPQTRRQLRAGGRRLCVRDPLPGENPTEQRLRPRR